MNLVESYRIVVGDPYRRVRKQASNKAGTLVVEELDLGLYRVEAFAYDEQTRCLDTHRCNEVVVARCLEGANQDRLFVFTPYAFAVQFSKVETVLNEVAGKSAGHISDSIHG